MPKETYFNLTPKKRERIESCAFEEFARYPYEQSSLSRLVAALGIAKGSMYQYFENKEDLYMHVVQTAYQKKRQYLKPLFSKGYGFFELITMYYKRSFLFAVKYPLQHQVIINFWDSNDSSLRQRLMQSKEVRASDFANMLRQAVAAGDVDSQLDREAAFFVYHSVGKALIDNFGQDGNVDLEAHLEFIESVLQVLRVGLEPRKLREGKKC